MSVYMHTTMFTVRCIIALLLALFAVSLSGALGYYRVARSFTNIIAVLSIIIICIIVHVHSSPDSAR